MFAPPLHIKLGLESIAPVALAQSGFNGKEKIELRNNKLPGIFLIVSKIVGIDLKSGINPLPESIVVGNLNEREGRAIEAGMAVKKVDGVIVFVPAVPPGDG